MGHRYSGLSWSLHNNNKSTEEVIYIVMCRLVQATKMTGSSSDNKI
jgi:hypothetical protein